MKMLDLFSGIGGFHLGLEQAGFEFDWVGFSEIDKYAKATYSKNFPEAVDLGDVRTIRHEDLPKIDIITFGSPCQDFSIAGKRAGLEGNRSSLIGEAIRLIADCKPHFFIWENVKGTFSSNNGADFWAIIKAFTNIGGYRLEWQLLNTRWFLPQNRERIYLVGCLGDGSGSKIFPIGESSKNAKRNGQSNNRLVVGFDSNYFKGSDGKRTMINQIGTIGEDSEATRVYDTSGCARTIKDGGGNNDNKTGLYEVRPVLTPNRAEKRQNGRRFKEDGEIEQQLEIREDGVSNTLTGVEKDNRVIQTAPTIRAEHHNTADVHFIPERTSIRRLTPTECERLQGFPDGWTEGQSDTQRYKQLGNAVSVPVVKAVGDRLID